MKKVIRKHYKLAFFLCMMLVTIVMGTSAMAENGTWYLSHTVDEFGDESGNPVIQSEITGTFSNTATAESELKVMAYIVSDDTGTIVGEGKYALAFRLFEYGDHVATYLSSDSKILKTKIGDTVTEYDLSGSAPNGDLYVDVNASVSSLKTKEDIENFLYGKTSNYGEEIAKQLVDGNDIKCVINIGSSKYNFVLEAGNIKDAFEELMQDGNHALPQDIAGQETRQQNQEKEAKEQEELKKHQDAEEYVKSMRNLIYSYLTDQLSENGYYEALYVADHYDEYPMLSQEELENIFPGTYVKYSLGNSGVAEGTEYIFDDSGNKRFMGFVYSDGTFRSREDWNPNYEEIEHTWKIEDGRLKLTKAVKYRDDRDFGLRTTGFDGYYFVCSYDEDEGFSAPWYLVVKCDDDGKPLYDLPEESANSNDSNDSDSNNIEIDNKMIDYINENGTYDENITLKDQGGENSFSGYCLEFVPEGATEASTWKFYTNADQANGFWYESIYSSKELNVNNTIYFLYPKKEMEFMYYYEVPDGWTDTNGNKYDFRGTFYLTMPIESYKNGQTFSADVEVLEYLDNADNEWKRIDTTQKMGDSAITTGLSSLIEQLQIFLEKDTDISMSDLGFTLEE